MTRAIVEKTETGEFRIRCPQGHLIWTIATGANSGYAGSQEEAEVARHSVGAPNRLDRLAAMCQARGHELDPTLHPALNEKREAYIGRKWVPCTPIRRRTAIALLISAEEAVATPRTLRSVREVPGRLYERLQRKRSRSRWNEYTRERSGVMDAYRTQFAEANPGGAQRTSRRVRPAVSADS